MAVAALAAAVALFAVPGALASGPAAADLNHDGVFDDLSAQIAPLAASARVNVIVRLDRTPTDPAVAALQSASARSRWGGCCRSSTASRPR